MSPHMPLNENNPKTLEEIIQTIQEEIEASKLQQSEDEFEFKFHRGRASAFYECLSLLKYLDINK